MTFQKIIVERRGNIGIVRMNDPTTLNAVTTGSCEELMAALADLSGSVRAMVLTGEGRGFCSGANLDPGTDLPDDFGLMLETHINPLMTALRDLPIPWVSAVRGPAAGVGCAIALAGDLIVAGESAYFLQAFVGIGLVPDGGSAHILARAAGRARAMEMMMLGERIPADQALDWGLINRVVADGEVEAVAIALAERLAAGPTKALGLIRKLGWDALDEGWEATLRSERALQDVCGRTHDAREAIAAFQDKRPAVFIGG